MVSRRKILSRSRDDLNLDQTFNPQEEEEDVWYQKEKLYKEHIQEVLDKWTQIDDEIWAKVIVFERNRRVAKAYARAPVLTINGSDDGFDGMRIGLCGFDNPMRDQKTDEFKRHIGQGVKIKMDDAGNILIRRYAKSNVYVKSTASSPNDETSIGAEILKLPNQALESEKIVKLFDMKKFQSNVNRELRRAYPDRRRLETQCLSAVAFVKSENDVLECPIWVLIVNVVAMDMLKSKLPPAQRPMVDIKNRPRIPIPDEDDPYSVAGNGSGGSSGSSGFGASHNGHQQQQSQQQQTLNGGNNIISNSNGNIHLNNNGHVAATREQLLLQTQQLAHKRSEKPPKLPPRDNIYSHDLIPKPDYDDIEVDSRIKLARGKSDKGKDNKKYDDPYYCGLRARVPNFVKSSKASKDHKDHPLLSNGNSTGMNTLTQKKTSMIQMPTSVPMHPTLIAPPPPHMHPHHIQQQQLMAAAAAHAIHHPAAAAHHHHNHHHQIWQTRSYESGIGSIHNPMASVGATANHANNNNNNINNYHHIDRTDMTIAPGHGPGPGPGPEHNYALEQELEHLQTKTNVQHPQTQHSNLQKQQQYYPLPLAPYAHRPIRSSSANPYYHHHHHHHNRQCLHRQPLSSKESYFLRPTLSPDRNKQIGSNCNCVSCHALAPLFGALPPTRPTRSLSQQQLMQHHRLSGNLVDVRSPGLVKWCSESDISELDHGAGDFDYQEDGIDFREKKQFERVLDDFDLDIMDVDIEADYMQQMHAHKRRHALNKKNRECPSRINFFGCNMQSECRPNNSSSNRHEMHSMDSYMNRNRDRNKSRERHRDGDRDRFRLRQVRSPPPILLPDEAFKDKASGLLGTRNKSLSIESFFEQPNEEGSLYYYGGRKQITKAPSTTNIYDRIRNSIDSDRTVQSGGDSNRNVKSNSQTNSNVISNEKELDMKGCSNSQPPIPPPYWRIKPSNEFILNKSGQDSIQVNANNKNRGSNISSLAVATKLTAIAIAKANNNVQQKQKQQQLQLQQQKQKQKQQITNFQQQQLDSDDINLKQSANNKISHFTVKTKTKDQHAPATTNNIVKSVKHQIAAPSITTTTIMTKPIVSVEAKESPNSNLTTTAAAKSIPLPNAKNAFRNHIDKNNNNNNDNNNNNNYINNKSTQQLSQQRIGRSTNRLDISDMESIYGYLKPRKPRSLSLKKIQILDY